ncbi:transposase [Haloglycomyces albus]|uniref:transposase n=1 Tax=Haloglycomyces albus TaxID=526067 RepID=UPI00046CD247|nr:transposase [Haloglycomyces albus]
MAKKGPYSEAYREKAVALSYLPGRSLVSVARDLGISTASLMNWRRQAQQNGTVPTNDKTPDLPPEVVTELRELRKKVRDLEQDNEILGKAMGWFANRNRGDSH